MSFARRVIPGLVIAVAGAAIAVWLASLFPTLSPLMVSIVLGIIVGNLAPMPPAAAGGLKFTASKLIRAGVVALGFRLSMSDMLGLGRQGIVLVLVVVSLALAGSIWLGRRLGLSHDMSTLVGTGYAICGLSAIAAVDGVIAADEAEVTYAMGLVTLVGTTSIFLLPALAGLIGLSPQVAGVWAGSAVHDVGQTVATASAMGEEALAVAIVVKLTRVALLAPVVALIAWVRRSRSASAADEARVGFPVFVLLFVAAVIVRTTGVVPDAALDAIRTMETWLFATALFATGTQVDVQSLRRLGGRPLAHGLTLWVVILIVAGIGAGLTA